MAIIIIGFIVLILILIWLGSSDLRRAVRKYLDQLPVQTQQGLSTSYKWLQRFNASASTEQTQQRWHLQQWWILIAGLTLFLSIILFSSTRRIDPNQLEADYLKVVDPQIYSLLNGEILLPPDSVNDQTINNALLAEQQLYPAISDATRSNPLAFMQQDEEAEFNAKSNLSYVDRKWDKMNPRYKQRLLMVFKTMKQRYGYDLILLEGYRSPARQNMLSGQPKTTRARAYQSYHQFGLAADIAFLRHDKVVISERDPWAMRGYQLYGQVAEEFGLTWGGRWRSIQDYGHTEYRLPGLVKNAETAQQLIAEGRVQ